MSHHSVLLHEVIEGLTIKPGQTVVDGTINGGGHSEAMARILGKEGILIGFDLDEEALSFAEKRLSNFSGKLLLCGASYKSMDTELEKVSIGKVHAVLLDLGLSSRQFELSKRGFTFQKNEPLLMTFRSQLKDDDLTAAEIVNTWDESNIADIIYGYGEERFARRIAKAIVETRTAKTIETTTELATIVKEATPRWYHRRRIHPATKTFQALRITVNDEIETLRIGLEKAVAQLARGGRVGVISFHSIEDRVVKIFFATQSREGVGVLINKKPITPSRHEIMENPRARSAKLRIFEKRQ